jgi:hypothetical protein
VKFVIIDHLGLHRAGQEDAVRRTRLHPEQSGAETPWCHPYCCRRTCVPRPGFALDDAQCSRARRVESNDPLTHIEALDLDRLRRHLIVIGGGYIGLELAQAVRRFGSVTVIERGAQLAEREDPDVGAALLDSWLSRELNPGV